MRHTFRIDLHPMQEGARSLGKTAFPTNVVESNVCRYVSFDGAILWPMLAISSCTLHF